MSLVAPTADLRLKSILVATDFSEASEKPLRHALATARHYGAKFYLVHVVSSLGFTLSNRFVVDWFDAWDITDGGPDPCFTSGISVAMAHQTWILHLGMGTANLVMAPN